MDNDHAFQTNMNTLGVVALGGQLPTLNFWLSENCRKIFLMSKIFRSKVQNFGFQLSILRLFRSKIVILSTYNYLRLSKIGI